MEEPHDALVLCLDIQLAKDETLNIASRYCAVNVRDDQSLRLAIEVDVELDLDVEFRHKVVGRISPLKMTMRMIHYVTLIQRQSFNYSPN